jgi:hypothetical protein
LLLEDLRRSTPCELVIGTRRSKLSSQYETTPCDLHDPHSVEKALSHVDIAICAAGPFQRIPTTLVERCIHNGVHYIDLADDRSFVHRVRSVVKSRTGKLPAVCTGWSTVSALSGTLVRFAVGSGSAGKVYIHMVAGNRSVWNRATIESLLLSVGQPFTVLRDSQWRTVTGWSDPRRFSFPNPIGERTAYLVNVPDLDIFPETFHAETVEFRAGGEFSLMNDAMAVLPRWSLRPGLLQAAARSFRFVGHDWGGLGVEVRGSTSRRVSVVADHEGQRLATMPASIMTAVLLERPTMQGLISPADWIKREDFQRECERRQFRFVVEEL